ncbi:MAG TPA: zinc-binding alcohol dehydrogenase [Hyphomicrobiales bacterium]|nr:zinc-binding alcohol dehydrogenase [Hyphomicrobiales bacterium]
MAPAKQTILMMTGPGEVAFQERALPSPGPGDVVVRPRLSSFKHGTEMMAYKGRSPFAHHGLDPELRIFMDRDEGNPFYPLPMGNMFAGEIEAAGPEVNGFVAGDLAFGWGPIGNRHILRANKLEPLGALTPEQALCIDPASFALGAVLDGAIESGETVYITGLGAIGLFAVQYCVARGAHVVASSAFASRRKLAAHFGAERVYDSKITDDLARLIKQETGSAHAAIECSGNLSSLHRSIRALRPCGRVVCVGFYSPADGHLDLGKEFFHNRISLHASLPAFGVGNPVRTDPPLFAKDLLRQCAEDFAAGTISVDGIITPILPFSEAEETVRLIANEPEAVIKVALRH